MLLSSFQLERPRHDAPQERILGWLADVHARAAAAAGDAPGGEVAFRDRIARLVRRVCCGPDRIATRGYSAPELVADPSICGTAARTDAFARDVDEVFARLYADVAEPPDDLVHVTCTGYVSPSGAQRLVSARGWGDRTRVTHAYHMGCYASVPALRIALGCLAEAPGKPRARRVDVVHTELCSLHFDPSAHSPEQLVIQSLFGDGSVRYALTDGGVDGDGETHGGTHGLRVVALDEVLASGTGDDMQWRLGDRGMRMALSRTVPERLAGMIRPFLVRLFAQADLDFAGERRRCAFAVHPGGPKIIDGVRDALELDEAQVEASRRVLRRFGNMSSATLPHIWSDLIADGSVAEGTLVASVAFGPGLTICGALLRKE